MNVAMIVTMIAVGTGALSFLIVKADLDLVAVRMFQNLGRDLSRPYVRPAEVGVPVESSPPQEWSGPQPWGSIRAWTESCPTPSVTLPTTWSVTAENGAPPPARFGQAFTVEELSEGEQWLATMAAYGRGERAVRLGSDEDGRRRVGPAAGDASANGSGRWEPVRRSLRDAS